MCTVKAGLGCMPVALPIVFYSSNYSVKKNGGPHLKVVTIKGRESKSRTHFSGCTILRLMSCKTHT